MVDEAHCISEWDHNFAPIPEAAGSSPRAGHTPGAAADRYRHPAVMADMQAKFGIDGDDLVVTGFYRPNLDLAVIPLAGNARDGWLRESDRDPGRPTIVYVTPQHSAEQCAAQLQASGIRRVPTMRGWIRPAQPDQHDFMAGRLRLHRRHHRLWHGASTRPTFAGSFTTICPNPSRTTARR